MPTQTIVVAEAGGQVVGFAAVSTPARELTQIFVVPDHQRQRIGHELLRWAQQRMPDGFRLTTLVDNVASRAFYERHGFMTGATQTNAVNGMDTIEYHWMPRAQEASERAETSCPGARTP